MSEPFHDDEIPYLIEWAKADIANADSLCMHSNNPSMEVLAFVESYQKQKDRIAQLESDRHAFAEETQMYRDNWLKDQNRIKQLTSALEVAREAINEARGWATYEIRKKCDKALTCIDEIMGEK